MENEVLTVDKETLTKAKRRIKRYITTGIPQHRVTKNKVHKNVYNYRIHEGTFIHFKTDKRGYLRKVV